MSKVKCNYLIHGDYTCTNKQNIIESFAEVPKSNTNFGDPCGNQIFTKIDNSGVNLAFNNPLSTCRKDLLNQKHSLKEPLTIIHSNNTFNISSGYKITDEIIAKKEIILLNINFDLFDDTINNNSELFLKNYVKFQLFIRVRVPGQIKSNDISISEQISYEASSNTNPINIIIKPNISYQIIGKIFINATELPMVEPSNIISKIQKTVLPKLSYSITSMEN